MFLDELREKSKNKYLTAELKEHRAAALCELLDSFAESEYKKIKESILKEAQAGNYRESGAAKVIEGHFDLSPKFFIPAKYHDLERELISHGEKPIFGSPIFTPCARVVPRTIVKTYKKRIFFKKRERRKEISAVTFLFSEETIALLERIRALAEKDNIELLSSTICYGTTRDYETKRALLEFDNLFTTSFYIEPEKGDPYPVSSKYFICTLKDFSPSNIRIRYRVEY